MGGVARMINHIFSQTLWIGGAAVPTLSLFIKGIWRVRPQTSMWLIEHRTTLNTRGMKRWNVFIMSHGGWTKRYLQGRVCVRVVVGQVTHILIVFEGDSEGQCIKGRSPSAMCWTKVVSGKKKKTVWTVCSRGNETPLLLRRLTFILSVGCQSCGLRVCSFTRMNFQWSTEFTSSQLARRWRVLTRT